MNVSRFKASDLEEIDVQPEQLEQLAYGREIARVLEQNITYTGRVDSRVVAIGGVISASKDVGYLWTLLARDAGAHMTRLHRMGLRLMRVCGKSRILATAVTNFQQGLRWLELLGFTLLDDDLDGEKLYLRVQS
jgi:hypothetical protein